MMYLKEIRNIMNALCGLPDGRLAHMWPLQGLEAFALDALGLAGYQLRLLCHIITL
jgi:hypothetical protein